MDPLAILDRLVGGLLSRRDRRRAFDAKALDDTMAFVDAQTTAFVDLLDGRLTAVTAARPLAAMEGRYTSMETIGNDVAALAWSDQVNYIRRRQESGQLTDGERAILRERLIALAVDVRAAAAKRRRELA